MENGVLCVFYALALSGYLYRSATCTSGVDCIFFLCALLFLFSLFCFIGFKTIGSANLSRAWLVSVSVYVVIKL